ncbi:MAG TPA: CPBP family intramembrane glutamic endopeptidase [Candidatus Deferrimicrobiaceae bacterium]|nr:CPBP family intramembrane glutamic endopeptidase [Candidatus Deferrimicrobiaceae bacterium]
MQNVTPVAIAALGLELAPAVLFGCAGERVARAMERWPVPLRLSVPALLVAPYAMVSISAHIFQWSWLALYMLLPVAIAGLLMRAAAVDPEQRGDWRDAFILLLFGLAVDLRWFDSAWPAGLRALNELFLVDAGVYGFLAIRRLHGVGFDFHLKWSDWKTGLRELIFFAPIVVVLGLALGFIHPHRNLPGIGNALLRWILIFFFTAVPEELFFRGWVQNLLERRVGRRTALVIASILFGLSHFNKRSAHFNWRYVLLATIAGIFYGRAWRERRRIPASTIMHASVDWLWGLWF